MLPISPLNVLNISELGDTEFRYSLMVKYRNAKDLSLKADDLAIKAKARTKDRNFIGYNTGV